MRLRYIELFHAVMSAGSLTGAARLLNISQPAASKALQQAEHQLGFALFSRVKGRLQPTENALLLRHRIDRIFQELHELERLTANIGRPEARPLRITCTPALAQPLLLDATTAMRKTWPNATAELFTQHSAEMCQSLMLHEVDIGLTLQDTSHQKLHQEALCRGRIMVIAPPDWWPREDLRKPLPMTALSDQPMIGIDVHDALGSMLENQLARIDPPPRTLVRVQTYQLAHALVAAGEGLALVDPFTARCHAGSGVQTRPMQLQLDVVLHALYRPDSPLSPIQRHFLDHVRKRARSLLKTG